MDALNVYAYAKQVDEGRCADSGLSDAGEQIGRAASDVAAGTAAEQRRDTAAAIGHYRDAHEKDNGNLLAAAALGRLGDRAVATTPAPIAIRIPPPGPSWWSTPAPYLLLSVLLLLTTIVGGAFVLMRTRRLDRRVHDDSVRLGHLLVRDKVTNKALRDGDTEIATMHRELRAQRDRLTGLVAEQDLLRAELALSTTSERGGQQSRGGSDELVWSSFGSLVDDDRFSRGSTLVVDVRFVRSHTGRSVVAERRIWRSIATDPTLAVVAFEAAGARLDSFVEEFCARPDRSGWTFESAWFTVDDTDGDDADGDTSEGNGAQLVDVVRSLVSDVRHGGPEVSAVAPEASNELCAVASLVVDGRQLASVVRTHERSHAILRLAAAGSLALGWAPTRQPYPEPERPVDVPHPQSTSDMPDTAANGPVVEVYVTALPHESLVPLYRGSSTRSITIREADGVSVGNRTRTTLDVTYEIRAFKVDAGRARQLLASRSTIIADIAGAPCVTDDHVHEFMRNLRNRRHEPEPPASTFQHSVRGVDESATEIERCDVVSVGSDSTQRLSISVPVRSVSVDLADVLGRSADLAREFLEAVRIDHGDGREIAAAITCAARSPSLNAISSALSGSVPPDVRYSLSDLHTAGVTHVAIGRNARVDTTTAITENRGFFTRAAAVGGVDALCRKIEAIRRPVAEQPPATGRLAPTFGSTSWSIHRRWGSHVEGPGDPQRRSDPGRVPGVGRGF